MGYLAKEKVKEIRQRLKKEFPNYTFSVVSSYGGVDVYIMKADILPVNNDGTNYINHYYIKDHWSLNQQAMEVLLKIQEVILDVEPQINYNKDNPYEGVDFNYYYNIQFGKYDKPYERI